MGFYLEWIGFSTATDPNGTDMRQPQHEILGSSPQLLKLFGEVPQVRFLLHVILVGSKNQRRNYGEDNNNKCGDPWVDHLEVVPNGLGI